MSDGVQLSVPIHQCFLVAIGKHGTVNIVCPDFMGQLTFVYINEIDFSNKSGLIGQRKYIVYSIYLRFIKTIFYEP